MTAEKVDFISTMQVWIPLVVSFTALAVSVFFGWNAQSDRRSAARLAREKDLHSWVAEVGQVYTSLLAGDVSEKGRSLARLSILVDYGRLLFPNERTQRALQEYSKGRRSSILDPLVETYARCKNQKTFDEAKLSEDFREFSDKLGNLTTAFAINTSPEAARKPQYRNR